jgi:hypothetical protein
MFRCTLVLAAMASSGLAQAAAPPPWLGVWQGTIGRLPVRACLQQRGGEYSNGSYYYMRQMKPIALEHQDNGSWAERDEGSDAVTGTWTVAAAGNRLAGQWRRGRITLPVALTRVALQPDEEDPCGSNAYVAPRVRPLRLVSKPASSKGFAYTELNWLVGSSFEDITLTSFAYRATRPGDAAINAALRVDPTRPEGEADYLGCIKGQLSSLGTDGSFAFSYEPALVTPEFLSVTANAGGDCGGAHPSESQWHLTFDRVSGRQVQLSRWFTSRGMVPGEPGDTSSVRQLTPALRALALKHFPFEQGEDSECRQAVSESDYWDLAIDRHGLAFEPSLPHVAQACGERALVPFAELAGFLSAEGHAGVARLAR